MLAVTERSPVLFMGEQEDVESATRDSAIALARKIGIPVVMRGPSDDFPWDGTALNGSSNGLDLFHDIAHWLASAPERRSHPHFAPIADAEESRASILGCLLMKRLGLEWEAMWYEHGWHDGIPLQTVKNRIRELRTEGVPFARRKAS